MLFSYEMFAGPRFNAGNAHAGIVAPIAGLPISPALGVDATVSPEIHIANNGLVLLRGARVRVPADHELRAHAVRRWLD